MVRISKRTVGRCVALALIASMVLGVLLSGAGVTISRAQGGTDGTATYILNMRTGPGVDHALITTVNAGTGLMLEARNGDTSWVLGHTEDGAMRGWVAALYLTYRDGFSPVYLPESDEVLAAPARAVPGNAPNRNALAEPGVHVNILEPMVAGSLGQVPVIPSIGPRVAEIFAQGQALGNDARVFTQVGECNTESQAFMIPFGTGYYNLGAYSHLQTTIDFFDSPVMGASNAFWYKGVAMDTGMTSMAVTDPALSNPAMCGAGVSLLECDYQRSHPAVALIMFGLYDVYWLTPAQYEVSMRRVLDISLQYGVIPVLATFPTHPGDTSNWPNDAESRNANRVAFNEIVVRLGQEYGIPVINLWRATQALYWSGLKEGDHQHMVEPPMIDGRYRTWFTGDEQQYSFALYNLLALQTLELLRAQVLAG